MSCWIYEWMNGLYEIYGFIIFWNYTIILRLRSQFKTKHIVENGFKSFEEPFWLLFCEFYLIKNFVASNMKLTSIIVNKCNRFLEIGGGVGWQNTVYNFCHCAKTRFWKMFIFIQNAILLSYGVTLQHFPVFKQIQTFLWMPFYWHLKCNVSH